jgi:elongation factor Ts
MDPGLVKKLREMSGAPVMGCRKALIQTNGDIEEAMEILMQEGLSTAAKKAGKETTEGLIYAYIHFGGKIGVLLELNCETDFVARTDEFKELAKDISMHIAWNNPRFISPEEAPDEERKDKDKEKHLPSCCLLEQPFIKDNEVKIKDYLSGAVARFGENIRIKRFVRYQLGT